MKKKNYITHTDSVKLYGIAILLMIFHHLFCMPKRLGFSYIPVLGGFEIESKIAYIGKMCVAIYAFITGYAFSTNKDCNIKYFEKFLNNLRFSANRIIKLYSKLWLVCIFFLPIGFLFYDVKFNIKEFAEGIFLGRAYNYEWWYVEQYIKFILLYPILDIVANDIDNTKKLLKRNEIIQMLIRCIICLITILYFRSTYTYIFVIAFLIGRYNVFENINTYVNIPVAIDILGIMSIGIARYLVVTNPYTDKCDILGVPAFIYFVVDIFHKKGDRGSISKMLKCFGKYSTYMWLIHTFWIYYYFQKIILLPKYSVLIYVWTILISLLNAWILEIVYNKFKIEIAIKKLFLILKQ